MTANGCRVWGVSDNNVLILGSDNKQNSEYTKNHCTGH